MNRKEMKDPPGKNEFGKEPGLALSERHKRQVWHFTKFFILLESQTYLDRKFTVGSSWGTEG